MIDLSTKIHDKFTLEFKVGFNTEQATKPMKYRDYVMNTWIFVPNSLDINAAKYSKDDFYRDLKSGVRLITPSYGIHELATDDTLLPSKALTTNFNDLHAAPDDTLDLTHTIKMYCAIAKSAFRDACFSASQQPDAATRKEACLQFLDDGRKILERFRGLFNQLNDDNATDRTRQVFSYGDEFLSNVLEKYTYRLRDAIRIHHPEEYPSVEAHFKEVLLDERKYREQKGYLCVKVDDEKGNEDFVFRASLLKKFSESDLYLNATKRKNTFLVEQILGADPIQPRRRCRHGGGYAVVVLLPAALRQLHPTLPYRAGYQLYVQGPTERLAASVLRQTRQQQSLRHADGFPCQR